MLTIRLAPTTIILLVLALAGCIEDGSAPTQPIGTPRPSPTVGTEWVLPEPDGEATGLPGECFHGLCLEEQPAVPADGPAADAGLVLLATQEEDHYGLEAHVGYLRYGSFHDGVYAWRPAGDSMYAYNLSSHSLHWVAYHEDDDFARLGYESYILLQVGQRNGDEKRLATWTVEDGLAWHSAPTYEGRGFGYDEPWLVYESASKNITSLNIQTGHTMALVHSDEALNLHLEGSVFKYYNTTAQSVVVRNLETGVEERFPVKREKWAGEHFGDGFVKYRANYSGGTIRFETTYHDFSSGPRDITSLVGKNCNPAAEVYPWLSLECFQTDEYPRMHCGFLNLETEERFVLGNSTFQSDQCVADGERFLVVMTDAGGHYGEYALRLYEGRLPGSSSPMNS